MNRNHNELLKTAERFFTEANPNRIRCIDERRFSPDSNGIQIQGGTYGLLDALKKILNISEEEARTIIIAKGIPLGAHTHVDLAELGCGYAAKVQSDPTSVGAVEAVSAEDRLNWIRANGGEVLVYTDEHDPQLAIINYKYGKTLDTNSAMGNGIGIFNFDAWAVPNLAKKLDIPDTSITNFTSLVVENYRNTVNTLAGSHIRGFQVLQ